MYSSDPLSVYCAVANCYRAQTEFDIYCEAHEYLTIAAIERVFFSEAL